MNAEIIAIVAVLMFTAVCWIAGGFTQMAIATLTGKDQGVEPSKPVGMIKDVYFQEDDKGVCVRATISPEFQDELKKMQAAGRMIGGGDIFAVRNRIREILDKYSKS